MSAGPGRVGFVGLGAIGAVQAGKLLESGRELAVFDTRPEAVERLAALGAEPCTSVAEVGERAATVMVSLPSPEVVAEVLTAEGGLLDAGAIETFVDLSTTGPGAARELARIAAERGVAYLDAPVSGGVAGAQAGALAVYAAGALEVLERCRPLLEPFAATIVAVGTEPGQGQVAKLLNNLLSATAMAATAEAMAVGTRAGLDPGSLLEAFNAGSGRNSATATKFPEQVLSCRFDSGFRLDLMLKDVRLALAAAAEEGVPMRVGSEVGEVWELAAEVAPEGADHTEIVRLFEDLG
jgi:3-hydroxyisobutyrate dehydrogenase-like beta-hydroxyacid dehydrogenase